MKYETNVIKWWVNRFYQSLWPGCGPPFYVKQPTHFFCSWCNQMYHACKIFCRTVSVGIFLILVENLIELKRKLILCSFDISILALSNNDKSPFFAPTFICSCSLPLKISKWVVFLMYALNKRFQFVWKCMRSIVDLFFLLLGFKGLRFLRMTTRKI